MSKYKSLDVYFNDTSAIGSELDIYIPALFLAIELNGILHYKIIYSKSVLDRMQKADKQKVVDCNSHNIDLWVIDTSEQTYFSIKTSLKYLNLICSLIDKYINPLLR